MTTTDYSGFNPGSTCPSYSGLAECTSAAPVTTEVPPLPVILGAYAQSGKARVVAWSDEWLTYDAVWETKQNCGQVVSHQPDVYWYRRHSMAGRLRGERQRQAVARCRL